VLLPDAIVGGIAERELRIEVVFVAWFARRRATASYWRLLALVREVLQLPTFRL
jgi:hypothetical protein